MKFPSQFPAVREDVKRMKQFWRTKYKYQHISCANDELGKTMDKDS